MALWEFFVDGAARGQGAARYRGLGHGAVGVVVCRNQKIEWQFARGLGRVTNNQAEYEAVLAAVLMGWSDQHIRHEDPIIYSDSQLVVNQVNGIWECRNAALIPYWLTIAKIRDEAEFRFRLVQVPRSHVMAADQMVNRFLDELETYLPELPTLDSLPIPRPVKE